MISISPKFRNISLVLLAFAGLSLWLMGRQVSDPNRKINWEPGDVEFIREDGHKPARNPYHSPELGSMCEEVDSTETANIELVDMVMSMGDVRLNDVATLQQFCEPYVYTKFYLRLGLNNKKDCAPESITRGKDCEWYHMCVWEEQEDIFISRRIILGGVWEEELVRLSVDIMWNKSGIVIDAGANIGQYSLTAAFLGHKVFAFEPIPQHVDMIRRSAALNGVSPRIHLFRNGLSDYNTQTFIYFHKNNKGGSTIERLDAHEDETATDTRFIPGSRIKINLITLDDVLPIMNDLYPKLDIAFWKADIEGYEPRMFRGAQKLFYQKRPAHIIFEILGKSFVRTNCKLPFLLRGIMELGYTVKIIDNGYITNDNIDAISEELLAIKAGKDVFLQRIDLSDKNKF